MTNDTLDFKTFMTAMDYDRPCGTCPRRSEDWFKLYEIAVEQVTKYGMDGSGIPLGAKVILADGSDIKLNVNRGYRGVCGPIGYFNGPVKEEKWADRYYAVNKTFLDDPNYVSHHTSWYWRPSWFRFLIVEDLA